MTDEEVVKLPRYEIHQLQLGVSNHSILKRKAGSGVLEDFMPNVGTLQNARFIVEALKVRDDENRHASEQREREFQESLKHPHNFLSASSRVAICYCGKPSGDPIHIEIDEDK